MPLQKYFITDEDFLKYLHRQSRDPDAIFSSREVNRLYVIAEIKPPFKFYSDEPCFFIPSSQPSMISLLARADERIFKKQGENSNIVYLDDFR